MAKYVAPDLCVGNWTLSNECTKSSDDKTMQSYIAENLEIAGAPINVFKLRGVHEQGLLIDLAKDGFPLSSGTSAGSDVTNAFDISSSSWRSAQLGLAVTNGAYLGYNFGTKKTSFGTEKYAAPARIVQHITTLKIQQGSLAVNRVLQARIERASGELIANTSYVGTGTGEIINLQPGYFSTEGTIIVSAISAIQFSVMSSIDGPLGNINIGQAYADKNVRFKILIGSVPFVVGDKFTIILSLDWKRADVVNFPNTANLETITLRTSAPASYWRIVPLLFNGTSSDSWEVVKLEMIDYQATSLDNIQDTLFLENRDRDYQTTSIMLKCAYQPFDAIGDLGKFGFSILDQYIFTCSFARMVQLLDRPIVIGDIIEITPEVQYDQHLNPVKKFLEVTDCGWAAEGYSPGWTPMMYRFQASQLLPSMENRDILKTPDQLLYATSDGSFFDDIGLQNSPLLITETNEVLAKDAVPEDGSNIQEIAGGMPEIVQGNLTGRFDQIGMYIEDGIPPDGLPYGEGYQLPPILNSQDGDYFRLNYPESSNIPTRLYKFSLLKNSWIYMETDLRKSMSSHKPALRNALQSLNKRSIKSDI